MDDRELAGTLAKIIENQVTLDKKIQFILDALYLKEEPKKEEKPIPKEEKPLEKEEPKKAIVEESDDDSFAGEEYDQDD